MAGNTTLNTDPAIRAIVHSEMLLMELEDGFLPEGLHRDVGDFGDGSVLQIPTLGQMVLHDILEEQDTPLSALDTGTVTLSITEHKGTGGYVTDELKEDGYKAQAVEANIVPSSIRAIKEAYESDLLATVNSGQVDAAPNAYNGVAHRVIASGTNQTVTLKDLAYLKLAFDKVHAPEAGRILIVDSIMGMTFNALIGAQAFSGNANPMFEPYVGTGFAKDRKFFGNMFGFDIWVSNRLPQVDTQTIDYTGVAVTPPVGAGSVGPFTGLVANIAMVVTDDATKPLMGAWRRAPRVEGWRNVSKRRDEFHVTARWGFGVQRAETMAVLLTSASAYE